LLSGESEKSKRFHPRNVRTFYPQILRKSLLEIIENRAELVLNAEIVAKASRDDS
jgi:hypothetical protein